MLVSCTQGALNLSCNNLSGSIPPSLATLQEVFIDFSHKNFSGAIPSNSYFLSLGEFAFTGNPSLCGSPSKIACPTSPSPSPSGTSSTATRSSPHFSQAALIGISVGCGAAAILLMATVVFYLVLRKLALAKRNLPRSESALLRGCLCSWRESSVSGRLSGGGEGEDGEGDDEEEEEKKGSGGAGELVHLSGVLGFSLEELLRGSAYVLGKGGVGIVYKAVLDEGTVVAVRRLGGGGERRLKEFHAEVKSMAQVRHPNVVSLHSYSWTADEKLLIYEYLSNGSLEMALYGRSERSKGFLTWETRLRIARGAAQGIAHIHECSSKNYVHGGIKPASILLDAFLEARVSDFGLRGLLALVESESLKEVGSTRGDNGTRGPSPGIGRRTGSPSGDHMVPPFMMGVYHAPEVANTKRLTQKSDVYSFGVVLLELLTGRSPFQQLTAGELDLVSWMRAALHEKKALSEIFDSCLLKSSNEQRKMIETLQVALACIAVNPDTRPKMKQVAELFEALVSS